MNELLGSVYFKFRVRFMSLGFREGSELKL